MIRPARLEDVPQILALITELATYERAADQVRATTQQLSDSLFATNPAVFCLVVEQEANGTDRAGEVVGFAMWFVTFSTWLGQHGIYLEDLFVQPAARRHGHGRALLTELARIATQRGYGRVDWAVLDWNSSAQAFYTAIGAEPMDEWTTWRLTGAALPALAGHVDDARNVVNRG
jgi:ribosomal protein S18 acetylase RimI-like enzyme